MSQCVVTVLKNMTNSLTVIGEIYIFRKGQNKKVWAALFLMLCPLSLFGTPFVLL
jgi:hypothetical protein